MKNLIKYFLTLLSLLSVSVSAQEKFNIVGKINGLPDGAIVRIIYKNGMPAENLIVTNGVFKTSGMLTEPTRASISTHPDWTYVDGKLSRFYQNFFLEKGETTIIGPTIQEAEIIGGPVQQEFIESGVAIVQEWCYDIFLPFGWAFFNDTAQYKKLIPTANVRLKKRNAMQESYIKSHPDSYISLNLLNDRLKPGFELNPLFTFIGPKMRQTLLGKQIIARLKLAREFAIGKFAPDFSQADTLGNQIKLSDFRGKYVLVEFWASWCKPCRAEIPNLIKAYEKFKDKNLQIIGVSLDHKKLNWTGAIKQDRIPWVNICDLQITGNAIAKAWGVGSVPDNFLIDPKGVIIARNLRGPRLEIKLKEVFK